MNGTRQGNHTEGVHTMTRFNTQLVHGLPVNDNNTGAVNPPIYNSSTYAFESVGTMPRWDYARSGNPTREFSWRSRSRSLSMAHAVLRSVPAWPPSTRCCPIFQPGDRIVVGKNIYGGTVAVPRVFRRASS